MVYRIWRAIRFARICKALGIKPTKDVKRAVYSDIRSLRVWGRQSGKTTAAILWTLMWRTVPARSLGEVYIPDPDMYKNSEIERLTREKFSRAHAACMKKRIKVFDIGK